MPLIKYWVIVDGATATAFRARERDMLMPTLKQLQRTQPSTAIQWFERGRLWASPEAANEERERRKAFRRERGKEWRPGGAHKDPRARYQLTRDQKRARFKRRARTKSET